MLFRRRMDEFDSTLPLRCVMNVLLITSIPADPLTLIPVPCVELSQKILFRTLAEARFTIVSAGWKPVPQVIQLLETIAVPPFSIIPVPIPPSILFLEMVGDANPVAVSPAAGPFIPPRTLLSNKGEEPATKTCVPLK